MIYVDKWLEFSTDNWDMTDGYFVSFIIRSRTQVIALELMIDKQKFKDLWGCYNWGSSPKPDNIIAIAKYLINNQMRVNGYSYNDLCNGVKQNIITVKRFKELLKEIGD